jgi:hypothetical protein
VLSAVNCAVQIQQLLTEENEKLVAVVNGAGIIYDRRFEELRSPRNANLLPKAKEL